MSNSKLTRKWTKKVLEKLIKDGEAHLVPASWTKSESWTRFRCVEVGDEALHIAHNAKLSSIQVVKEFAVCKQCGLWLSVPIGHTTTLQRHNTSHINKINTEPGQLKMTSFLPKKTETPKHIREIAQRAALYMIAKDIQPFSCVQDGFRHFAQTMIDIGSKYGLVPLEDIMFDRTTLSKTLLPKFYNECVRKLKDELAGINHVAITTDHWTDDILKYSSQAFTVHYINNSFCLISKCVGLFEFSESKTGIAVKAKTTEILKKLFPQTIRSDNLVFVTDNGSNMKSAYRNDVSLSCACHNLNLAVKKALKSPGANLVHEMIKASKEVVGYFKHSGKNQELSHTLKQDFSTRWNSQFFLLQSLSCQLDHVKSILADSKQFDKLEQLNNVNEKLLYDVVEFLHLFHKATVQLSHDNVPTSPDVWPMLFCLRSVCKINGSDSDSMRYLKAAFLSNLNEKYIIHPLHKPSTLIVPSYKYLSFINAEDRNFVYSEMRSMVEKVIFSSPPLVIRKDSGSTDIDSFSECSHSDQLSPLKKSKADPELYALLADFKTAATPLSKADSNDTRHEFDKYLALP